MSVEREVRVRLPEDLAERLDEVALRSGRERSEIVREALEVFLIPPRAGKPIDRARDLLGQIESGIPDLGQRHREYLRRLLKDGQRPSAA